MNDDASTPGPVGSPVDRGVRALDPERAEFEQWMCKRYEDTDDLLWRDAQFPEDYHYGSTQAAWEAWRAARAWVLMSERKPKGGQLIVQRWRHGAVWAGTHNEGPKNEAFDEWKAL